MGSELGPPSMADIWLRGWQLQLPVNLRFVDTVGAIPHLWYVTWQGKGRRYRRIGSAKWRSRSCRRYRRSIASMLRQYESDRNALAASRW